MERLIHTFITSKEINVDVFEMTKDTYRLELTNGHQTLPYIRVNVNEGHNGYKIVIDSADVPFEKEAVWQFLRWLDQGSKI